MGLIMYLLMIVGTSMMPTLEPGLHNVTIVHEPLINHIYCYNYNHYYYPEYNYRYLCHRLLDIENKYCYFKGDNNTDWDLRIECKYIALEVIN